MLVGIARNTLERIPGSSMRLNTMLIKIKMEKKGIILVVDANHGKLRILQFLKEKGLGSRWRRGNSLFKS
jgi:hypothetical protein